MRLSKKILVFGLFFLLICLIPNNVVLGDALYVTIENFDSYPSGETSGSNSYLSWESTTQYGLTTNSFYNSAPNSLRMKQTNPYTDVWLNMTTDLEYNGIEFKYRCSGFTSNTNFNMFFYNDTGVALIDFYFNITTVPTIYVYDDTIDTMMFFVHTYSFNTWYTIGMQNNHSATSPINAVYFYFKNSTGAILYDIEIPIDGINTWNNELLSNIKIDESGNANDHYYYFDDFKITTENFADDSGDYLQYCEGAIYHHANIQYHYIATQTNMPFTGVLRYVDLWVNTLQLTLVSNTLSDYTATVNGINIGSPSLYIPQMGSEYALRWDGLNLEYEDQVLVIKFYSADHYTAGGNTFYWYNLPYGNKVGGYGIGCFSNSNYFTTSGFNYDYLIDGDMRICLYYELIEPDPEPTCSDDDDLIVTQPYGNYIYKPIFVDATVSSYSSTYIKVIYDDVVDYFYIMTLCRDSFEYTPMNEGTYTIEINRSGVGVYSEDVWVSDNVTPEYTDGKIYLDKYKIKPYEQVRINWLYNYTKIGKDGFIVWSKSLNNLDLLYNTLKKDIQGDNIYEGISTTMFSENNVRYYIFLCYSDNKTVILDVAILDVGDFLSDYNSISTLYYENLQSYVDLLGKYSASVIINVETSYAGHDVFININDGRAIIPVTSKYFKTTYYCGAGSYHARLILNDNGVLTELDSCDFIVLPVSPTRPNQPDRGDGTRFGFISEENLPLAGLFLSVCISGLVAYGGGGGVGFVGSFFGLTTLFSIPSTSITFFPPVVMFICGFVLILMVVMIFVKGR